jgi:methyl-accepting chemotaxis protein
MNLLRNLSLRASVSLFAALAVLMIFALGLLSFVSMRSSEALAERVLSDVKLTRAAGAADMMHDALRGDVLAAQVAGAKATDEKKKAILDDLAKHVKTIQAEIASIEAAQPDPAVKAQLLKVKPAVLAYAAGASKLAQAALAGELASDLQTSFEKAFVDLEDSLAALSGLVEASSAADVAQQANTFAKARWTTAAAMALSTALLALLGGCFIRSTLRQLGAEPRDLREFSLRIAGGSLSARLTQQPPAHSVADAMLRMQRMLADAVQSIRAGADSVAVASSQLAQGNQDLSQRTEQQAATLEETSASMTQLGSTVKQNADNVMRAKQMALGASAVASQGGAVVSQVVDTMKGINDSSRKIADIIGAIDGIAFQTNILALNAAVEAARAGEQGRGFAVVASEVRSLAGRSAEAAREIKSLISASVERVEQGSALVDQAGVTMTEVVASIERVNDIMGEISTATAEQSAGIAQVGEAVNQMDRATQQNAALVEESAAASEGLKRQAEALVRSVSVFNGADDHAGAQPDPAAATKPAPASGARRLHPARLRELAA